MAVFTRMPSGELVLKSLTQRCGGCSGSGSEPESKSEPKLESDETETNNTEVDDHASGH